MTLRDTLLIVDDMGSSRAILKEIFANSYNTLEAENGAQALFLLQQDRSCIAAVLLDIMMPVMDGYGVLAEMAGNGMLSEIPVIVITASEAAQDKTQAFEMGATDIIAKPYDPSVIRHRVQNIVDLYRHKWHLEELVEEQAQTLRNSNEIMVDALSSIIEYRSAESGQHVLRIRRFTRLLLEEIARSCPEYELDDNTILLIASAATLHDIGKISIPDSILNKPGRLTKEEFEVMKSHTVNGSEMLEHLTGMGNEDYLRYAYNICRYHHERWDGRGYPDGLKGDEIPICAQAAGLADCYDALTTPRVYKPPFPHEQAVNMIVNGECGVFSPAVIECFKRVHGEFEALAAAYADGKNPRSETVSLPLPGPRRRQGAETLQLAQAKYQTLMHYTDATVMEMDFDSGLYHMVYNPNPDFDPIKLHSSFTDTMVEIEHSGVHPEDVPLVRSAHAFFSDYFFQQDLRRHTMRYRIYSALLGDYQPYDVTLLRIDTGDEERRQALQIWRPAPPPELPERRQMPAAPGLSHAAMFGLTSIMLRCKYSRDLSIAMGAGGMYSLVGLTESELEKRFGNSLAAMMLPEDRERVLSEIRAQLLRATRVEVEFRLTRKDGQVIWILCKGRLSAEPDGEYLYFALVDSSKAKEDQERLRSSLERHQIIMDQTSDIIFEWDVAQDRLTCSSKWETRFGYPPMSGSFTEGLRTSGHCHPEDAVTLLSDFKKALRSRHTGTMEREVRILGAEGSYVWNRLRWTFQYDADGNARRAVGVIIDIDKERRESELLRRLAQHDDLTGLLNRTTAQELVREALREQTRASAMLLIDLDSFRKVNHTHGHAVGDRMLIRTAEEIRRHFRSQDIICRIGGDEFLVFVANVTGDTLCDRSTQLRRAIRRLFEEEVPDCPVTCSVGAAFAVDCDETYEGLFARAESALYQEKQNRET